MPNFKANQNEPIDDCVITSTSHVTTVQVSFLKLVLLPLILMFGHKSSKRPTIDQNYTSFDHLENILTGLAKQFNDSGTQN